PLSTLLRLPPPPSSTLFPYTTLFRSVALSAPDVVRPRGPAEIGVKVAGLASGEDAYVTLAAVDEAVLKLTEFDSPMPEKYYFGRSEEHTSELQSLAYLVCRLLLEKKK